jgi:nucleoid DNA-binding protein
MVRNYKPIKISEMTLIEEVVEDTQVNMNTATKVILHFLFLLSTKLYCLNIVRIKHIGTFKVVSKRYCSNLGKKPRGRVMVIKFIPCKSLKDLLPKW